MSDSDPISFRRPASATSTDPGRGTPVIADMSANSSRSSPPPTAATHPGREPPIVVFNRLELNDIFNVYGRRVAAGEWRDYAIDWGRESAVFSVFRRASEVPIYRVVKAPKLARKQGAYSIVTASGQILKRGHDLKRVLEVIDCRLSVVK